MSSRIQRYSVRANWFGSGLLPLLCCLFVVTRGLAAESQSSQRGLGAVARPLSDAERAAVGLPRESSAGLFVGVGRFDENSGLGNLRFTPDDAVALAHLFVVELDLLPPKNARLALGGEPRSKRGKELLAALSAKGVKVIGARRTELLDAIAEVSDLGASEAGLVLMSFSSHGFEEKGKAYVMPADGRRRFVESTGVSLQSVKETLRDSKAGKKLLFLDACRETLGSETRGEERMRGSFQQALAAAQGFGVLASCSVGQMSWESPDLEQGVFTHFLLRGIRGEAVSSKGDGFIRLGEVSSYAAAATREWVARNKRDVQEPWFEGELAREIPLAFDQRVAQQREAQRAAEAQLTQRRAHALDLLTEARKANRDLLTGKLEDDVTAAVQTLRGQPLTELLEQLEDLADPKAARVRSFVAWWRSRPQPSSSTAILDGLLIPTTNRPTMGVARLTNFTVATPGSRPRLSTSVTMLTRGLDGDFSDRLKKVLDARASGFGDFEGREAAITERIVDRIGNVAIKPQGTEFISTLTFVNARRVNILDIDGRRSFRIEYGPDSKTAVPTSGSLLEAMRESLGPDYSEKTEVYQTGTVSQVNFVKKGGDKPAVMVRPHSQGIRVIIPAVAD